MHAPSSMGKKYNLLSELSSCLALRLLLMQEASPFMTAIDIMLRKPYSTSIISHIAALRHAK